MKSIHIVTLHFLDTQCSTEYELIKNHKPYFTEDCLNYKNITAPAGSVMTCALACCVYTRCHSFTIKHTTEDGSMCRLYESVFTEGSTELISSSDVDYYYDPPTTAQR